jgi:hypothetical protein
MYWNYSSQDRREWLQLGILFPMKFLPAAEAVRLAARRSERECRTRFAILKSYAACLGSISS